MRLLIKAYLFSALFLGIFIGSILVFADNSTTSVTVSNAAPAVSAVTLNGGSAITLTENATTAVAITATITDSNSCEDVFTSGTISAVIYRTGVTASSSCTNDPRNCYQNITLAEVDNTCNGVADTSGDAVATGSIWYFADPTDTSSSYSGQGWTVAVTATDGSSASASSTAVVALNSLYALNVTASITYGSIAAGASSTADQIATSTNTGNFKIDNEISGTDMTAGAFTLVATNQKFGTSSAVHPDLTYTLSTSATAINLDVPVAVTSTSPTSTATTYWRINIPNGSRTGSYSGTNTFTAIYSSN